MKTHLKFIASLTASLPLALLAAQPAFAQPKPTLCVVQAFRVPEGTAARLFLGEKKFSIERDQGDSSVTFLKTTSFEIPNATSVAVEVRLEHFAGSETLIHGSLTLSLTEGLKSSARINLVRSGVTSIMATAEKNGDEYRLSCGLFGNDPETFSL